MKLQFNAEENWTKALKYLLINVKYILGWVSVNQDAFSTENYNTIGTDLEDTSLQDDLTDDESQYEMIEAPPDIVSNMLSQFADVQ